MGRSYEPRRIILPAFSVANFQIWPYPTCRHNPMVAAWRPGWRRSDRHAHESTCLAPWHHVQCPCNGHGTFHDWSTHRGRALCEKNERYSAFSLAVTGAVLEVSHVIIPGSVHVKTLFYVPKVSSSTFQIQRPQGCKGTSAFWVLVLSGRPE